MIGRYPDYDVLSAADTWDAATRKVVLARLEPTRPLRFFTAAEEPTLRAFCDTVLAQDADPRVPVPEMVDAKLADGEFDGYQYADMPDDRETWRMVLAGLDEAARTAGADSFAAADAEDAGTSSGEFAKAQLDGGAWEKLNVKRAWSVVMRGALGAFYSHPWAWNEIGFGGPAYPRGYMRLGGAAGAAGAVRGARGAPRTRSASVEAREPSMGDFWRGILKGAVGPRDNDSRYLLDVHSRDLPGEATMRRYSDDEEVDLVIVGAGAGGSVLAQRLARRGLADRDPGGGPVLAPRRGLGVRRGGFPRPVLDAEADHRRRRPDRAGQEQLRPRRGRLDGALRRLHPPLPPERLRDLHPRRGRRRLADHLRRRAAALRAGRAGTARGRAGLAVGIPAPLSALAASGRRGRPTKIWRGRAEARHRDAGRARWASSTAPSATGRTASTAATACRAARSTPRPARTSPTCPTRWPTASRSGPTAWPCASSSTRAAPRAGSSIRHDDDGSPGAAPAGQGGGGGRVFDRDTPAAAQLDQPRASPTGWATTTTRSAAT